VRTDVSTVNTQSSGELDELAQERQVHAAVGDHLRAVADRAGLELADDVRQGGRVHDGVREDVADLVLQAAVVEHLGEHLRAGAVLHRLPDVVARNVAELGVPVQDPHVVGLVGGGIYRAGAG
jgi:hypothetical protein